jgi:hypothetical protein
MITYAISRDKDNGQRVVSATVDGETYITSDSNPKFAEIVRRCRRLDKSVVELFNIEEQINERLSAVADNVRIENGVLLINDEAAPPALSRVILGLIEEGSDDYERFVKFLVRLDKNPSHRSRTQLFEFIQRHGITLTEDGLMVLYKGVQRDAEGNLTSINAGTAWVNGKKVEGLIPANVGDTVTMPRRMISDDPNVACHVGLHCGAWDYAHGFGRDATITVVVDPENVVCVPNDCSFQKIRVCEYLIQGVQEKEHPFVTWERDAFDYDEEDDLEDDDYEEWNGYSFR